MTSIKINGDGCVTGGHPRFQTCAWGTNTALDEFDSRTSPPTLPN